MLSSLKYRTKPALYCVLTVDLAAILKTIIHTHTVHICIYKYKYWAGKSCMILTTLTVNRALIAPLSFLNQPLHTVIRTSSPLLSNDFSSSLPLNLH